MTSTYWNTATLCGKFPSESITPVANTTYNLGCQAGANTTKPYLTAYMIDNAGTKDVSGAREAAGVRVQASVHAHARVCLAHCSRCRRCCRCRATTTFSRWWTISHDPRCRFSAGALQRPPPDPLPLIAHTRKCVCKLLSPAAATGMGGRGRHGCTASACSWRACSPGRGGGC